jgi:predicted nucleotidyltransferase
MPDSGPTYTDIEAANELITIINRGKTTKKVKEITIELVNVLTDAILNSYDQQKPIRMRYSAESFVEIFDSKIPTGLATWHITGIPKLSAVELKETIKNLSPNDPLFLKFVDVEIIEIFPDWFIREAQRLSQLLAERFEIETVYLFGSLVWNDIHTPETDIDLAVSGLPEERFLEAVSYLERESKFPIDLIDLSKASDHLRQRILAEGKLLYERESVTAFG